MNYKYFQLLGFSWLIEGCKWASSEEKRLMSSVRAIVPEISSNFIETQENVWGWRVAVVLVGGAIIWLGLRFHFQFRYIKILT